MFVNHDLKLESILSSSILRKGDGFLFVTCASCFHFKQFSVIFHEEEKRSSTVKLFPVMNQGTNNACLYNKLYNTFFQFTTNCTILFQLYSRLYNTFFSFTADCTISDKQQTAVLSRPAQNLARKSCRVLEVSSKGVPRKRFLPPDSLEKNENEDNLAKSWKPRDFQKGKISTKSYHRPRLNPNS